MRVLLHHETYLTMILEFVSSLELIRTVVILSKFHDAFLHSTQRCNALIKRMLRSEFGVVPDDTAAAVPSSDGAVPAGRGPLSLVRKMHGFWDGAASDGDSGDAMERLLRHRDEWTFAGLRHFILSLSRRSAISVDLMAWDSEWRGPAVLQRHNEHILFSVFERVLRSLRSEEGDAMDVAADDDEGDGLEPASDLLSAPAFGAVPLDERLLRRWAPKMARFLEVLHWMAVDHEYEVEAADLWTFYRFYPFLGGAVRAKMVALLFGPGAPSISSLFAPLRRHRVESGHFGGGFARSAWPKWSSFATEHLLPDVVHSAVRRISENHRRRNREGDAPLLEVLGEIADVLGLRAMHRLFLSMLRSGGEDASFCEAVLFCILELRERADIESELSGAVLRRKMMHFEPSHVPEILSETMNLKAIDRDEALRLTATKLFGALCGCLQSGDHVLRLSFNAFVVDGLVGRHSDAIKDAAVGGWRLFCHHFKGQAMPSAFTQTVYEIYCRASDFDLGQQHVLSLMAGLMTIFTHFSNLKEAKKSIAYLLQIPYRNLTAITSADDGGIFNGDAIAESVERISAILSHCKLDHMQFQLMMSESSHLSMKLLLKIWPQLRHLMRLHHGDRRVMQHTVDCFKAVISECPRDYALSALMRPVLDDVIAFYCGGSPQPAFLELLCVYLNEFDDDDDVVDSVCSAFDAITAATFRVLREERASFDGHHQTVEAFYRMASRCLEVRSASLVDGNEAVFHRLFEMGVNGLSLEDGDASSAITSFYKNIMALRSPSDAAPSGGQFVDDALGRSGEGLVEALFEAMSATESVDEYQAAELGDLLDRVFVHCPTQCRHWMMATPSASAHSARASPAAAHSDHEKQAMVHSFCSAASKTQRMRLVAGWCGQSEWADDSEPEDDDVGPIGRGLGGSSFFDFSLSP